MYISINRKLTKESMKYEAKSVRNTFKDSGIILFISMSTDFVDKCWGDSRYRVYICQV